MDNNFCQQLEQIFLEYDKIFSFHTFSSPHKGSLLIDAIFHALKNHGNIVIFTTPNIEYDPDSADYFDHVFKSMNVPLTKPLNKSYHSRWGGNPGGNLDDLMYWFGIDEESINLNRKTKEKNDEFLIRVMKTAKASRRKPNEQKRLKNYIENLYILLDSILVYVRNEKKHLPKGLYLLYLLEDSYRVLSNVAGYPTNNNISFYSMLYSLNTAAAPEDNRITYINWGATAENPSMMYGTEPLQSSETIHKSLQNLVYDIYNIPFPSNESFTSFNFESLLSDANIAAFLEKFPCNRLLANLSNSYEEYKSNQNMCYLEQVKDVLCEKTLYDSTQSIHTIATHIHNSIENINYALENLEKLSKLPWIKPSSPFLNKIKSTQRSLNKSKEALNCSYNFSTEACKESMKDENIFLQKSNDERFKDMIKIYISYIARNRDFDTFYHGYSEYNPFYRLKFFISEKTDCSFIQKDLENILIKCKNDETYNGMELFQEYSLVCKADTIEDLYFLYFRKYWECCSIRGWLQKFDEYCSIMKSICNTNKKDCRCKFLKHLRALKIKALTPPLLKCKRHR